LRGYRSAELQDLQELLADRLLTEEFYAAEVRRVLEKDRPLIAQESWGRPQSRESWDSPPAHEGWGCAAGPASPASRKKRTTFEKGDSNRCRNVYEQILRVDLPPHILDAQKKNKHVSVGRCRMLAINHSVALPPYENLSRAGFIEADVPPEEWCVPTDCKRFLKKLPDEGLCCGACKTCDVPRTLQSISG